MCLKAGRVPASAKISKTGPSPRSPYHGKDPQRNPPFLRRASFSFPLSQQRHLPTSPHVRRCVGRSLTLPLLLPCRPLAYVLVAMQVGQRALAVRLVVGPVALVPAIHTNSCEVNTQNQTDQEQNSNIRTLAASNSARGSRRQHGVV
jgi:hypothetical protein